MLDCLQDFGIHIPPQLTTTPGTVLYLFHDRWQAAGWRCRRGWMRATLPHVTGVFNLVAFLAIAVVTTVLMIGIQESANLNTAIVIVKLAVVGIFLVLGIGYILKHPALAHANWTPFIPPSEGPGSVRHQAALRRVRRRSSLRISGSMRCRRRRRRRRIRSGTCRSAFWGRW